MRISLSELVQEEGELFVDFPMDSLSHSDFLRSVGSRDTVVYAHKREEFLENGRSELFASVVPNVDRDSEGPQHSSADGLHSVVLLQRFARDEHGSPQ